MESRSARSLTDRQSTKPPQIGRRHHALESKRDADAKLKLKHNARGRFGVATEQKAARTCSELCAFDRAAPHGWQTALCYYWCDE
jgi:hypothetical protein